MSEPVERQGRAWRAGTIAAVLLFALGLTLLASWRYSPQVYWQGRDDGIYAYDSMVIESGGVLFRDTWENKPPGALYTVALGFALFGADRWGIWVTELVVIALAALTMAGLMLALFRRLSVVLAGTAAFILLARHPDFAADANFTESYALLPQVLFLALGYAFMRRPSMRLAALGGVVAAAVFLFKVTAVGAALMIIPALVITRHPAARAADRWRWLGATIAGGLITLGAVALYFAAHGVLPAAIDGIAVQPGAFHRWVSTEEASIVDMVIRTLLWTTVPFVLGPLLPFWGAAVVQALRRHPAPDTPSEDAASVRTLALWATLTLVADLLLTNLTNRGYRHYYITPVPALAIMVALGVAWVRTVRWPPDRPHLLARVAWAYLIFWLVFRPAQDTIQRWSWADWNLRALVREDPVSVYIREHTAPDDRVLVWGASSEYNFQSRRFSPSQYHYAYPLIVPREGVDEQIAEFVADLERNRPALVVDAAWSDGEYVPPLMADIREAWRAEKDRRAMSDLSAVFAFVEAHCAEEIILRDVYLYRCSYD